MIEFVRQSIAGKLGRGTTANCSTDDLYEVLRNDRRRAVIRTLGAEGSMGIGDLSRRLAGREMGVPPEVVGSEKRKNLYIALHQSHLPKMDGAGLLRYDEQSGVVSPCDGVRAVVRAMEDLEAVAEKEGDE